MKALGRVIAPALVATISHPSASHRIPLIEALLCIKKLMNFHLMAWYWYHTEAILRLMENDLDEFHRHDVVWSGFRTSISTNNVLEPSKRQLTLDKQWEHGSDPDSNNHSAAAKRGPADDDEMQIESQIAQHLVDESDFNLVKLPQWNHFSDHIRQLGNFLNASSELPDRAMMELKHAYRQSNCHEAAFQILQMKAQKEVCQY